MSPYTTQRHRCEITALGVARGSAASISTPWSLVACIQGQMSHKDAWQLWGAFLGPLYPRTSFEIRHFPLVPTLNWCPAGLDWPGPYGHRLTLAAAPGPALWERALPAQPGCPLCHRLPLPPACPCCPWQQTFLSGPAGHPHANTWFHQFMFTEDRVNITCSLWNDVHQTW